MKMKITVFLIASLLLISCNNKEKEVAIRYSNGKPQKVEYYRLKNNKKIVNKVVYYYIDGQKESVIEKKNGKKHGEVVYYYRSGGKKLEENYKNGELHGKSVKYYKNGEYSFKSSWKKGLPHGKWIYYDKNGNKKSVQKFDEGELVE